MILALDPGPERSALVVMDGMTVFRAMLEPNAYVLGVLRAWAGEGGALVVEQIESFGMAVGREVFETCVWSGRFIEAWATGEHAQARPWARLTRREIKLHLCGTVKAKDPNVRQALIDRYGGKDAAIGRKAQPGPLHGIRADMWAALACGVTYQDQQR